MSEIVARAPLRPLAWSDALLDLFDHIAALDVPAYVVGGAVRDAWLSRPVKDLDIATPESGTRLARQLANALGGAYYALDSERDTGRAIIELDGEKLVIDVARFRGENLLADLLDRDFTINAMAVDLRGDPTQIIDPVGGERDAAAHVLRRCHDSALRQDPVRALRAVRQSVQLGFQLDRETAADVRITAPLLAQVSPERARDELFRLMALSKAAAALKVADALGVLPVVLPETIALRSAGAWGQTLDAIERLSEMIVTFGPTRTDQTAAKFSLGMLVMGLDRFRPALRAHTLATWADDRAHQALLILALLLSAADPALAAERARRLPLSNRELERLLLLLSSRDAYDLLGSDRAPLTLHRYWRRLGDAGIDLCFLSLARYLARTGVTIDQDDWIRQVERARALLEAYFDHHAQIVEPPVLVDGNALMQSLALKPGPRVGQLLDAIREAQVQGHVTSREAALEFARALLRDLEEQQ
jgi:tRNA nucleotidyltransferase/poly(A) polymerase